MEINVYNAKIKNHAQHVRKGLILFKENALNHVKVANTEKEIDVIAVEVTVKSVRI